MKRIIDYAVGFAVAALLFLLLGAGLTEPPEGLHGVLKSQGPYVRGPSISVEIGPPSLFDRLKQEQWGSDALRLTSWSVSYGNRWHRAITVPELRGPLDKEGKAWCGIAARISPGVLDPAQSGRGLLELVRGEMNKVLPMTLPCGFTRNVHLSKPKTVSLKMIPREGAIDLEVVAVLADGTKVGAASTIRLVANAEGHLVVDHTGPVKPLFAGPARARCEGTLKVQLGQLWWKYIKGRRGSIVLATAQAQMSRQIKPALDALNQSLAKLHEPMRPFGDAVEMSLRLARPPVVGADGIALRLCAHVRLGDTRIDPAITGPPLVRADPPKMPPVARGARIDVAFNAEALNRMIYVLWQGGELRRWGSSTEILDQLPPDVKALAFDVTGFDPRLPPVLDAARSRVTAANIAVGTWGKRTVFGHATAEMRLQSRGSTALMTAKIDRLAVTCAQRDGRRWRFSPCLSELLPMIHETLADNPPHFSLDTSRLVQAIAGHTVHGLKLELSPPRLQLRQGTLRAEMSVQVGVVGR